MIRCSAALARFLTSNPQPGGRGVMVVVTATGAMIWPMVPDDAA